MKRHPKIRDVQVITDTDDGVRILQSLAVSAVKTRAG
jgi:hypothetical protein